MITIWSYPILPIALVIASWVAYRKQRNVLAAVLSGLSFAPPILLYLCLAISSFGWYFQYLQNGMPVP